MIDEELRLFIEYAPVAIAMMDRDIRYVVASRQWRIDYGLGGQDLRGRSHYELFPEIGEEWKAVHRRCLAGAAESCDGERFVRADGTVQWVRWAVHPWHTADGKVGGIIMFAEDITTRKNAEAALRRNEAKLRAVFDSLAEGVVFLNPQGGVVEVNAGARRQGHTLEQFIDPRRDPRYHAVHPDGTPFPVDEQPPMVALRTGRAVQGVEMGVPTADGQFVWRMASAQPVYGEERQLLGVVASFFDITERRHAEQALRESEQRLRLALDASSAGIWYWDIPSGVICWDARCSELFGVDPSQSPSFDAWAALLHPDDREPVLARLDTMLHTPGDDEWDIEYRIVHPQRGVVRLEGRGRMERDASGGPTRFTGIALTARATPQSVRAHPVLD
jgi:PAS domain S-box-containing protein